MPLSVVGRHKNLKQAPSADVMAQETWWESVCRCAVVGKGKIVEQGNHAELVARPNGAYATLVRLQQSAPAVDTKPRKEVDGEADFALAAHSSKMLVSQVIVLGLC